MVIQRHSEKFCQIDVKALFLESFFIEVVGVYKKAIFINRYFCHGCFLL